MTNIVRPANPLALMFWLWGRRRALRRYLKILPLRLAEDYGHAGPYAPAQVEAAIRRNKLVTLGFDAYAMAIFCEREAAEGAWRTGGRTHDHAALRKEVGRICFHGAANFTVRDIKRFSAIHGGYNGGGDGGGDGAGYYGDGHHGGDGHGGDGGGH